MNQQTQIIQPLTGKQQQHVIDKTHSYIHEAEQLLDTRLKPVEVVFNLKGRAAGMYRISAQKKRLFSSAKREIRYNTFIFSKYFEDNVATTIPHEVAHYITDMIYGLKNIKPHGAEWKSIMSAFDADASVTANYDLSGITLKKQTRYTYNCDCREHQISTVRHNRILNNQHRYYCKVCKQGLQYKQG